GQHPHVIQPVEYYRTKRDPNRVAVIAYSLGSLTWGWYTAPHLILSLVVNFGLAKGCLGEETKTYIESAAVIPVFRNILRVGNKTLMRIEKLWDHIGRDDHS
ncbi:CapA family protein, partial [Mesorhizobium sp. M2D.F.Ca.ET.224.01.1.1]